MKFDYAPGATPLNPDEANGLIPLHISTHAQLNEWEAANILRAENWLFSNFNHDNFLEMGFLRLVHKKMFDETWEWAGTFRKSEKNIGVEFPVITTELRKLLDDVTYQLINASYSLDEIAFRFHHRLVWIHPFANGNGRHSRLMADLLLMKAGEKSFTWGKINLVNEGANRQKYIRALREADKGNFSLLADFVRS